MNVVLTELKVAMTKNESRNCKYHIVFIGASGAGKTSLLNLIGNFGTMNEGGCDRITTDFKRYNDTKLERALDDPMASKTSSSRSYDMKIGDVTFMITDTPGLGVDSSGIGKEKENVANIVQHLKTVEYVHCICLVINGRTPRGIPEVKYALSEISALLPNVATSNMIMCLTNCEKIFQASLKPQIFHEFFKNVIDPNKTFCIDNPLCIMENAMRLNKIDDELEDIKRGFDLANKEFRKLVHSIKEFDPIPTTSFLEVYTAKQAVEREVLAITMHQYNHEELQKKKTAKNAGKVTFRRIIMTEDQHYNTLCDHPVMAAEGCYKVLLIGHSGAGKTSMLNLVYNLEKVRALQGKYGPELFHSCHDTAFERLLSNPMESKTTEAKEYCLTFSDIYMNIIDTPGFGDTQGTEKDDEHLRTIQSTARNVKSIDCCWLIVNGRQPRATLHLQKALEQISAVLYGDLKECTIVILTNVRKLSEASIDVTKLLHYTASQSLDDIYCIENPYCAVEQTNQLPDAFKDQELADSVRKTLKASDNTIKRIVERIKKLRRTKTEVLQMAGREEALKLDDQQQKGDGKGQNIPDSACLGATITQRQSKQFSESLCCVVTSQPTAPKQQKNSATKQPVVNNQPTKAEDWYLARIRDYLADHACSGLPLAGLLKPHPLKDTLGLLKGKVPTATVRIDLT
ncbi:hypothetical protein EMCRGX_G004730 [Ephydatia muelleri]